MVVELIAATTTQTRVTVHAELDPGGYPLSVKVSDQQLAAVPLARHDFHGKWNYTITPRAYGLLQHHDVTDLVVRTIP